MGRSTEKPILDITFKKENRDFMPRLSVCVCFFFVSNAIKKSRCYKGTFFRRYNHP